MSLMRVRDLVELLKGVDQDLPVATEGCDCTASAGGVEVQEGELMVLRSQRDAPFFSTKGSDSLRIFSGEGE